MLIFGAMQIVGSLGDLIIFAGLISLIMPIIVTSMDVSDHRKSGRGFFEHKSHCWMQETARDNRRLMKSMVAG